MRLSAIFVTSSSLFLLLTSHVKSQQVASGSDVSVDDYTYDLYDPEGEEGDYFSTGTNLGSTGIYNSKEVPFISRQSVDNLWKICQK